MTKTYRVDFTVREKGSVLVKAENERKAQERYIEEIQNGNASYNKNYYSLDEITLEKT